VPPAPDGGGAWVPRRVPRVEGAPICSAAGAVVLTGMDRSLMGMRRPASWNMEWNELERALLLSPPLHRTLPCLHPCSRT
jgi:hypothetical protein